MSRTIYLFTGSLILTILLYMYWEAYGGGLYALIMWAMIWGIYAIFKTIIWLATRR